MANDLWIALGQIVGAHGIKGVLRIKPYAESAAVLRTDTSIRLSHSSGWEKTVAARWVKPHSKGWLLAIKGVGTRDQAQALIGADILIERARLPELEDDAYYWSDLIGLSVFSEQGEFLGKVKTIMRTGSNDVYVVQDRSDGNTRETLVPALKWVVLEVNLEQGTMHVNLPEGL